MMPPRHINNGRISKISACQQEGAQDFSVPEFKNSTGPQVPLNNDCSLIKKLLLFFLPVKKIFHPSWQY